MLMILFRNTIVPAESILLPTEQLWGRQMCDFYYSSEHIYSPSTLLTNNPERELQEWT